MCRPVVSPDSPNKPPPFKHYLERAAERAVHERSALIEKKGLPPANVQAHLESVELLLRVAASRQDS